MDCTVSVNTTGSDDLHPSGSATNIGSPSGNFVSEVLLLVAHGLSSAQSVPRLTSRNIMLVIGHMSVRKLVTTKSLWKLTTTSHQTCLRSTISYSDSPNAVPSR